MYQFDSIIIGSFSIAQSEAQEMKHSELFSEHLLLGLIRNKSSFLSRIFQEEEAKILEVLRKKPSLKEPLSLDQLKMSSDLSKWLTYANAEMAKDGRSEISEKDLLKFLTKIFPHISLDFNKLQDANSQEVPDFLINLNQLAIKGKLDPVIGRTKEIRAVMEILGRRNKNNPILVGAAGVGKTAIVEGLAYQIIQNKVPDVLKGKEVYSLDMGALMAGTKFRGEFEERIQKLLKFIKEKSGESILFIDEIHQLVGAGRTDGAMDAANLLKPALARGELHCIGATTPEEFHKYILGDAALERRFRAVPVETPSKEDSIEILMGVKEKLEIHHGITISDEAVYGAVILSDQYITDKNLPDKAIDLLDEAASSLKLSAEAMPSDLVELQSEIRSKNILAQVEKDNKDILSDIAKLQIQFDKGKIKWSKEVEGLKLMSDLKNKLEKYNIELERAERNQQYEEAGKLKYSLIPEIRAKLETFQHSWILGRDHVAQVIARQTGIPIEKILKTKQDHLLNLEEFLKSRVYGQEVALQEMAEILMTGHAGLSHPNRPMGSFLLLGPTGVGKTETAKALATCLFEDESKIIRLDLSEYSEKHSVAKLIGSPPGYVGHEDGGVLTEAVRKNPYSIILFDEIEKSHRDFADILLQILDEGRLTDNKGRVINFKNTIVIMTSNSKDPHLDFKPEVLGRIDAILTYLPLNKNVMRNLVEKECVFLNERLRTKNLKIKLAEHFIDVLCERGYDPHFGARPLNAVFSKLVSRPLSKKILEGNLPEGSAVLDWIDGELKFALKV